MRTPILSITVLWLLSTGWSEGYQEPAGLPAEPGVYVRNDSGKWARLTQAPATSSTIQGMDVFLQTGGQTNLDMTFTFSGAKAELQLTERRPVFYVRGVGQPREALIVKLQTGRSMRTARASHSAAASGNKAGFRPHDIRRVTASRVSERLFSVIPSEELKPGEYFLTFGTTVTVFDFGITRK